MPQRSLRVPLHAFPAQRPDPSRSPSECTTSRALPIPPYMLPAWSSAPWRSRPPLTRATHTHKQVVHGRQVDARHVREHTAHSQGWRRPGGGAGGARDDHTRRRRRRGQSHTSSAGQQPPQLRGCGRRPRRRASRLCGGGVPSSAKRRARWSRCCLPSCHGARTSSVHTTCVHGVSLAEHACPELHLLSARCAVLLELYTPRAGTLGFRVVSPRRKPPPAGFRCVAGARERLWRLKHSAPASAFAGSRCVSLLGSRGAHSVRGWW